MTSAKKADMIILDKVIYIYYLVWFQKGGKKVYKAIINFVNEINAMTPVYIKYLGL